MSGLRQSSMDRAAIELLQSRSKPRHLHKKAFQSFPSLLSHQYFTLHGDQSHQLRPYLCALQTHREVNGVYCTFHHCPLCGVENSLTGLYLWPAGLLGMNHEKDHNHLVGCSFKLSAGQLCGSVCGRCGENRASV